MAMSAPIVSRCPSFFTPTTETGYFIGTQFYDFQTKGRPTTTTTRPHKPSVQLIEGNSTLEPVKGSTQGQPEGTPLGVGGLVCAGGREASVVFRFVGGGAGYRGFCSCSVDGAGFPIHAERPIRLCALSQRNPVRSNGRCIQNVGVHGVRLKSYPG